MALFSFGGKKTTPEPAAPKIQPPPTPSASPSTPPPSIPAQGAAQPPSAPRPGAPATPPANAAPAAGRAVGGIAATRGVTQPIVMPKRGPGGAPVRSTQRIVIPGGAPQAPDAATPPQFHTSTVQLPVSMILKALPLPALSGTPADLERSPAGAQKLSVPLSLILPQLPTGKIEIAFQELVNLLPAELLAPKDRLAPYLSNLIHLPLMEVVMLIPPDMLALRNDQKNVDASVSSMADPFKLEDLQREAAKAAAAPNPLGAGMTSTAPMPGHGERRAPAPLTPPVRPPAASQPPARPPATPTSASTPPLPPGPSRPTVTPPGSLPQGSAQRPTISLPMVKPPTNTARSQTTQAPTPPAQPVQQTPTPPQPQATPARTTPPPPPQPIAQAPTQPPPPPEPEPQQPEYAPDVEEGHTAAPEPVKTPETPRPARPAGPLNLNSCGAEELALIPGISAEVAQSIVAYRTKIGKFSKLHDLLEVPHMTRAIYTLLTGDESQPSTINDLLGFPAEQSLALKDIVERIACWPDITGCVLGQSNGLPIVSHLTSRVKYDKATIMAFAPRMFDALNKSFSEISGTQTDELIIPTQDTSFHILRKGNLYLIILARTPQMPSRHLQVARLVLSALNYNK